MEKQNKTIEECLDETYNEYVKNFSKEPNIRVLSEYMYKDLLNHVRFFEGDVDCELRSYRGAEVIFTLKEDVIEVY